MPESSIVRMLIVSVPLGIAVPGAFIMVRLGIVRVSLRKSRQQKLTMTKQKCFQEAVRLCLPPPNTTPTLSNVMSLKKMWLIDAGYLFKARHSVIEGFEFKYFKAR
jgi:hypothetical protein